MSYRTIRVALLTLGAFAVVALSGCERAAGVFLETRSPGQRYWITLSGNPGRASAFSEHVIRVSVFREGIRLIEAREIHFADWMDSNWDVDYVGHTWIQENVLRFQARYPTPSQQHRTSDVLTVKNAAAQPVTFLRIATAADLVLMFDLAPGTTTHVLTTGRTDVNWFRVDGIWQDKTEVPSTSPNYSDMPRAGSEVAISIDRDVVSVTRHDRPSNQPLRPTSGGGGVASEK